MDREIKFRAWDIENKIMHPIITDVHWEISGLLVGCKWCASEIDDGVLNNNAHHVGGKDRFILMQYTGLKDKEGKDLDWWEGDIFVRTDTSVDYIIFEDGSFWMWDEKHKYRQPLHECKEWADIYTKTGNIHQNPELLT